MARCGCVSTCACVVQVTDGACLDLAVQGSGSVNNPYIITGEVRVDGVSITCGPNGLTANVNIVGDVNSDGCVNTSVVEGPDNVFTLESTLVIQPNSADPNGGPNPGNGAICTPTGLSVPPSVEAGNAIRYGTDGRLYVSPTALEVDAVLTDCIDLQITGDGSPGNPFQISAEPIIADNVPNVLTCTDDGLLVPPSPTVVNAVDNAQNINVAGSGTDTLTFTCEQVPLQPGNGVPGGPCVQPFGNTCDGFGFNLGIDPDPCNGIQCGPNGLETKGPLDFNAPSPFFIPGVNSVGNVIPPTNFAGTFANTVIGPTTCSTVTNTNCRGGVLYADTTLVIDQSEGAGTLTTRLEFNVNGGPFGPAQGKTTTGNSREGGQTFSRLNLGVIGPGQSVTVCMRMSVDGAGVVGGQVGGRPSEFAFDVYGMVI